ncbi:uncharacterized protein LOC144709769 isoform X2 [Wolffia australiana]
MAKKRKSVASRLDEVDRNMYSSFCSAANSLSQIYTQAMNQQKIAFQAGERHGVEKIYSWISRRQEQGLAPTMADLIGYLQSEIEHGGDDLSNSPRYQPQHGPLHAGASAWFGPPRTNTLHSGTTATPLGSGEAAMDTHSDTHSIY